MDPSISTFKRKRIFAIGTPEECRALSWGFRQLESPSSSPEITEASLSDLSAASKEADFLVCFVDLGQPVPINALSDIGNKIPGTIVFTQPTPTQLLSVFQLPQWTAILWDGSSTDSLCIQLQQRLNESEQIVRQKTFLRDAIHVLNRSKSVPAYLEWINPPPGRQGQTNFALNPLLVSITIGSDQSKSQIEIPSAVKGPLLELKFIEGRWMPRALDASVDISRSSQTDGIKAGETIKIGDQLLAARATESLAHLEMLISQEKQGNEELPASVEESKNLEAFLQNLMTRMMTGEVHVTSGLRRATICIHTGGIDQVFAGPVTGEKALERVMTWPHPTWKFREGNFSLREEPSLKILSTDFSIFCTQVKRNWERVTALVPPMNITLDVDSGKFSRLSTMTPQQTKVLSAVCEFRLVRDVLNYCPLRDLEIYDELIAFRKSGLIRISK